MENQAVLKHKLSRGDIITRYGTVFATAAVFVIFAVLSERFTAPDNLVNLLKQASVLLIVAMGQTIAFAAGEMDMSTGNLVCVTNVVCAWAMVMQGWNLALAIVVPMLIGLGVGFFNGIMTTKIRIPSIIVTLGMSTALYGVAFIFSNGKSIYGSKISQDILDLATGQFGPISNLTVIAIIFIVFTYLFLNKMLIGRHIYAVGGNMKAANLSGINTAKLRILSMVLCSVFSAFAGILLVGRLAAGTPSSGASYTLDGISAVFIGMTCIRAGRANVIGTIIGVFLTYFLTNGLTMLGVSTYIQNIVSGFVMIGAVALAATRQELKFFRS